MAAPITIEQIILNHAIGVNLSDAGTFNGLTVDQFSMVGHQHSADDVTSGVFSQQRLPVATTASRGIVSLSTSVESESTSLAATPHVVQQVRQLALGKANESHNHAPGDINAGTFPNQMAVAGNINYSTAQLRNVILSTSNPTNAVGENGDLYFKYEN